MASTTPQDNSLSFSKRYFHFKKTLVEDYADEEEEEEERSDNMREMLKLNKSSSSRPENQVKDPTKNPSMQHQQQQTSAKPPRRKLSAILAVSKLKTSIALNKARAHFSSQHRTRVLIGTLFGHKRGHVLISLQHDFKLQPSFLVELATPMSVLVREMASGLVRIALECEKKAHEHQKKGSNSNDKLLEEPFWRTYCNGKKCGYAIKRDCGVEEWKVLNDIGQTSMGAGVLPGAGHVADDEVMYMRATFERVVGSKDSEAYYMMNPDGNGGTGPELSVYLLRV